MGLEVTRASGSFIYDSAGNKYLDFIAGISANTLGHGHPKISQAIKNQVDQYTHVMVYGEFIQKPQLDFAKTLIEHLPESLETAYITNSGTEATEGALKLAKRYTGRAEIIAAKNAYHGNTQGAMSVCGNEHQNSAFRPLIPGIQFIEFNNISDIDRITSNTAGVILETIQGGAGFIEPKDDYLKKIKEKCKEVGALLILDEIQTGIGRTGTFFGFENYNVVPDILVAGKGLGGGMPIGVFIASHKIMSCLKKDPKLGHITTFGGHPVITAAAKATLDALFQSDLMEQAIQKEELFRMLLIHPLINEIRGKGLMLALIVESSEMASKIILRCMEKGLLLFWLLFEGRAVRITPPLTISHREIQEGCNIILHILDELATES